MVKRVMSLDEKKVKLKCSWCGDKADFIIKKNDRSICGYCHGFCYTADELDNEEIRWIDSLEVDEPEDIKRIEKMWEKHVEKFGG